VSNTSKRLSKKQKISKLIDLMNQSYIGKIVSVDDPDFVGRCKIMVYGVYGDESNKLGSIPESDLPYAYPLFDLTFGKNGAGKFSTPKVGTIVRVIFDGDQYHPRYFSVENIDKDLLEKLKFDYKDFHSILFDEGEKLRLYYSKKNGLLFNLDDSIINVLPNNSIIIEHKNSSSVIELAGTTITIRSNSAVDITTNNTITHNSNYVHVNGVRTDLGANAIFSNVNGEPLFVLLKALAAIIDAKLPITNGKVAELVQNAEVACLSKTVKTTP
jgi:hypothetical protein